MTNILAQQEFLPTDLILEPTFWTYGIPGIILVAGIILIALFRDDFVKSVGLVASFAGAIMLVLVLTAGDLPDRSQNYENLKSNVRAIYDVDSMTLLDRSVDNGDKVKIQSDNRIYEVFVAWDAETFEPTLSPTNSTADDIEALKK